MKCGSTITCLSSLYTVRCKLSDRWGLFMFRSRSFFVISFVIYNSNSLLIIVFFFVVKDDPFP